MTNEIDLDATPPRRKSRPWFLTLAGLLTISGLIAMPLLAGKPDGEKMPDLVRFLGHFHPVVLHLPIGIFTLIIFQELLAMFTRYKPQPSILPIFTGAASAVVAVLFGFLLYQGGGFEGDLVEDHLWGGVAFSCAAVFTLVVKAWVMSPLASQAFYRLLVFGSVGVMGVASHNGASITHGKDYLFEYAPNPVREAFGYEPKEPEEEKEAKPLEEQVVYADLVQPILNKRCVQCHKEGKSKGKLRMDTFEMLVKGGREGSAIDPGDAFNSNIVFRVELPLDDEEHMPPDGKPEMEDHELAVVKWWIDSGADPEVKAGELELDDEVRGAIGKLDLAIVDSAQTTAPPEQKLDLPSEELRATVAELSEKFPGGLTFESQSSSGLTFTGVSMRDRLGDEEFADLEPVIPKLVSVDLSSTSVTDTSVAMLAPAKDLRMIRLPETEITDAALDILAELKLLESVNLYGTAVTDEGVAKLAALPNLKRLYLWQTEVSEEAMDELRETNPDLEIITGI